MLKLYQADLSPFSARVQIQLRAKKIDNVEFLSPPGGLASDEYKKINPTGKIPYLMVDDVGIAESAVICEYIEELWPLPALLPNDPLVRAQVRLIVQCIDLYVTTPMFKTIALLSVRGQKGNELNGLLSDIQSGLQTVDEFRIKSGMAGQRYTIGEGLTLADGAIAGALFFVENYVIPTFKLNDVIPEGLRSLNSALAKDPIICGVLSEMRVAFDSKIKQN